MPEKDIATGQTDMTDKMSAETLDGGAAAENATLGTQHHSHGEHHSHSEHHSHHSRGEHHSHGDHGHHSHHHHHHSSHKRCKKKKTANSNRKEKFAVFLRRNKHYLIYTAMTIVFLICLVLVGGHMDRRSEVASDSSQGEQNPGGATDKENAEDAVGVGEVRLHIPFFSKEVEIVSSAVRTFLTLDDNITVRQYYSQLKGGSDRLDAVLPVELYYEIADLPDGYRVKSVEFLVADNEEFYNPYIVKAGANVTKADIYNLKTGAQYHYRINLCFTDDSTTSIGGSFRTAAGPRLLLVDGVRNIRDVGGWESVDGKTIKQGLLYRGRELDGAVRSDYSITAQGVHTMVTQLGIKTDMDLRQPTDNKYGTDALGQGIKHIYYSAPMYANIFNSEENKEKIRLIFADLAKPENYPIYLHCTHGVDRTGTVCYLLGALLGVDGDNLLKDYQLSGLAHGDVSTEYMDIFLEAVEQLPGATLREKVEGYLLSIGVTSKEIASIRRIFLEY